MKVLFGLCVLLVFIVSLELMTRIMSSVSPVYDVEMSRYSRELKVSDPDPELGFLHRKKTGGNFMGVRLEIDEQGDRREEPKTTASGDRNIFFLGDSLTLGWGVSEKETFARRLEVKLSESCGPVKVFNFGHGNYNLSRSVRLLKKTLPEIKPHGIILFYFINDAEDLIAAPESGPWSKSEFVSLLWSRLRPSNRQGFREYYRGLYREGKPGWEKTKKAFGELSEIARSLEIPLGVVILPELRELDPYPFTSEHEQILQVAGKNGIPATDVTAAFKIESPSTLWVAPDDSHPNSKAHKLIVTHSQSFVQSTLGGCK